MAVGGGGIDRPAFFLRCAKGIADDGGKQLVEPGPAIGREAVQQTLPVGNREIL